MNFYEDGLSRQAVSRALEQIFRTRSGKALCRTMAVAALACSVPYEEILLLLLLPALTCFLTVARGEKK